jgi:glycerol-3-phosphate acyltransferase PlsY
VTEAVIKALFAYALGNVMGGQVVGLLRGGVDLRRFGSGNVGATNALRTQGLSFGLSVLAIDVLKGLVAVLAIPAIPWPALPPPWPRAWIAYGCGVGVALGHCYPATLGFRGGKGVATLAGVFAALMTPALPWILLVFALVVMLSGYVSLATIAAAVTALYYAACIDGRGLASALGAFTVAMFLLVLFKHRGNLRRLWRGKEARFEKARVLGRLFDKEKKENA